MLIVFNPISLPVIFDVFLTNCFSSAYLYCFCSVAKSCLTLCEPMDCNTAPFPILHYFPCLFKFMSIESVMLFNHLILCCLLLLLPSVLPRLRVFSNELALHIRWPKCWSFSFSISLSNEYSRLISFRIDWFDLIGVQWTLKSLLQHHNSKASIFHLSAFLMVQHSYPYMTTGNTIALTIWTFVSIIMSLLFNRLSSFVIAFLPRSNHLLISWLQSLSAVVLEPKTVKSGKICHYFQFLTVYLS